MKSTFFSIVIVIIMSFQISTFAESFDITEKIKCGYYYSQDDNNNAFIGFQFSNDVKPNERLHILKEIRDHINDYLDGKI